MALWVRFEADGEIGFGMLEGAFVRLHAGTMFGEPRDTGRILPLASVKLLTPCEPTKIVALWNNFHQLAAKLNQPIPAEPLYLLKATSSITTPGATIRKPPNYSGKVVYEGELGIVVGKTATAVTEAEAHSRIFGYTIVNDVTAADILNRDASFPQWARAKSCDGFGPFGPAIATDLDPATLSVRTTLNGEVRQNYALSDMIFPPAKLVSLISQDMTLHPGDLIAFGTSIGVGVMKEPSNVVEVAIDGIGVLRNVFEP